MYCMFCACVFFIRFIIIIVCISVNKRVNYVPRCCTSSVCFVCVYPAAVGKADTAASLLAQQSADISSEKVSAQPSQLAASYGIGTIDCTLAFQVLAENRL